MIIYQNAFAWELTYKFEVQKHLCEMVCFLSFRFVCAKKGKKIVESLLNVNKDKSSA